MLKTVLRCFKSFFTFRKLGISSQVEDSSSVQFSETSVRSTIDDSIQESSRCSGQVEDCNSIQFSESPSTLIVEDSTEESPNSSAALHIPDNDYPEYILPQKSYILNIDIKNLNSAVEDIVIVRRSNFKTKDETFDNLGLLQTGALYKNENEIPGMSMNIFGGKFTAPDLKWVQQGINSNNWQGQEVSISDLHMPNIRKLNEEDVCPIFLSLKSLLAVTIPFSKEVNDKAILEKDLKKANYDSKSETAGVTTKGKPTKVVTLNYVGSIDIKHVPTISNYWHVELNLSEDVKREHIIDKIKSFKPDISENQQAHTTKAALQFFHRIKWIALETGDNYGNVDESYWIQNKLAV